MLRNAVVCTRVREPPMPGRRRVPGPQPAARHVEPNQVLPANTAPPDGRPRLDGVVGASVASGAADGRPSLSRFPPLEPGFDPRPAARRHGRYPRRRQRVAGARLQGRGADRLVTRIDPGVVSLVAEFRAHEQPVDQELEKGKTHHEERRVIDASPAAITLALALSPVELDELEPGQRIKGTPARVD